MKNIRIFDRNLYIEALRQLRTIGVVSGVIFILQSALIPLFIFVNGHDRFQMEPSEMNFVAVSFLLTAVAILMPIMANILFSFINQRNASDFYHALPVRRETMYITYLVAIFSWCLVLFSIPAILEYLLFLPMSFVKLDLSLVGYMFADTMVIGLLLTSVLLIAKCITGTRFGTLAVVCMILLLPRLYLIYIRMMVEYIHPFVILDGGHNIFWDYSWNLLLGISESAKEPRSIIYTLVLSVIYFIIAGILFVKRKSEKAESVSISSRLQLVLRVLPALTFSMLPMYYILEQLYTYESNGFEDDAAAILFILYIVAIVIYFLYELLTTRKLRSAIKAAPGLLWLAAANIVMLLFIKCYGDYQAQICPAAEEISSVRFIGTDNSTYYHYGYLFEEISDYFNAQMEDIEFKNDVINEIIAEGLQRTQELNSPYRYGAKTLIVEIQYNGKKIYRKIVLDSISVLVDQVINDESFFRFADVFPAYDSKTCTLGFYNITGITNDDLYFTDNQMAKIYNQALEELALLDNSSQYALIARADIPCLYISFYYNNSSLRYELHISIDEQLMPKTWKLIQDYSL